MTDCSLVILTRHCVMCCINFVAVCCRRYNSGAPQHGIIVYLRMPQKKCNRQNEDRTVHLDLDSTLVQYLLLVAVIVQSICASPYPSFSLIRVCHLHCLLREEVCSRRVCAARTTPISSESAQAHSACVWGFTGFDATAHSLQVREGYANNEANDKIGISVG